METSRTLPVTCVLDGSLVHRRTGRCGVLAIATWAAWFWAAQSRLFTKKKEEGNGKKKRERKKEEKEEEKKRKKREEKKGKNTWDRYGPVIPCLGFVRHCIYKALNITVRQ